MTTFLWVDPVKNTTGAVRVSDHCRFGQTMAADVAEKISQPHRHSTEKRSYGMEWGGPHNPMMDEKGENLGDVEYIRPAENPDFLQGGIGFRRSPNISRWRRRAKPRSCVRSRNEEIHIPVDTCFKHASSPNSASIKTKHAISSAGPEGRPFGWLNTPGL